MQHAPKFRESWRPRRSRRRAFIDKDKFPKMFPHNNILEAEAVLEGGNVDDVGAMGKDKGDPPIRTLCSNQPSEVVPLIAKTMQELMARKLKKMITDARGGGAKPKERRRLTKDGAKALKPKKRKQDFFFFL
jgi:hypothetical protein